MINCAAKASREGFFWSPEQAYTGLTTESVVPSIGDIKDSYDAIVIGAGFAGLTAARDLSQKHKVLLVEARDRIGGRTWTARALGGETFEMGGTWVRWDQAHVYHELVRYGLHKTLIGSSGSLAAEKYYYKGRDGKLIASDPAEAESADMARMQDRFFTGPDGEPPRQLMPFPADILRGGQLWRKYDHLSVRQRLDLIDEPDEIKAKFEAVVLGCALNSTTETGFTEALHWFSSGGYDLMRSSESTAKWRLGCGGMTEFARAMYSDFTGDALFDTAVTKIVQDGTLVTLTTSRGKKFQAKNVVCTVPLNVLPDIEFSPALPPAHEEAIKHPHANKGYKIHYRLAGVERPWASAGVFETASLSTALTDRADDDGQFVVGFGFTGKFPDVEDDKHMISALKTDAYPDAQVNAYLVHDWVCDPFAKGAWAGRGPGQYGKYLAELQQAHGRVFMASGDWADGWTGFVDGAIERGLLAAVDVNALLMEKNA